jgi:pyruvate/2-oxoglutarate dehydrogenase complex dihydrolipoamide acyltransferase (E2) component
MPLLASTTGRTGALSAVVACLAVVLAAGAPTARGAAPGAFTAPDDPTVPGLISGLRACLSGLAAPDRRVLTLRSGLGGHAPQSSAQVGATLGESTAAATAAEVIAIRRLEAQRRRGACQAQPAAAPGQPAAATATKPATPTPATPAAATPATPKSTGGSSSGSTTGVFEILVPALLVLAFVAGISLEMNRRPRP